MNNARKETFKDSVYGIVSAGELYYSKSLLNPTGISGTETFTLSNSAWTSTEQLKVNGKLPESGTILVGENGKVSLAIINGKWCAKKGFSDTTVTVDEDIANCVLKEYKEAILNGADPEVGTGLIPVTIDTDGTVKKADTTTIWYEYGSKKWANAVTVTEGTRTKYAQAGTTIEEKDILTYLVWIPRYRYELWNAENGNSDPREIQIVFENKDTTRSTGSKNLEWLTHPAFTFGTEELNGFWVGKFETGYRQSEDMSDTSAWTKAGAQQATANASKVIIKPNVYSWRNITLSNMFKTALAMKDSGNIFGFSEASDTHMMKNMEWGAVAYLSHSKYGVNGEIWINNCENYVTGIAGDSVSEGQSSSTCTTAINKWNGARGVNASTTGNITGVYDMSGGANEYVMGNMVNGSEAFYSSNAGFTTPYPDNKYYDSYAYGETYTDAVAHSRGKLGDATRETLKTFGGGASAGWYGDYSYFPGSTYSWFIRGGNYNYGPYAGAFSFNRGNGISSSFNSWRVVVQSR